ncbi:MAG TPA: gamma-glutamyltransferase [Gemmatimonadaceae bacterium]|nr:gamma-glutamyltransferase [Gemmatimonadaceae bacterium]
MLAIVTAVLLQGAVVQEGTTGSIRNPAYAADGRLAVSVRGDLWILDSAAANRWTRVTSGIEWDREPAWSADGKSLVFASNRSGSFAIWRVTPGGAAVRVTTTTETDAEPSVARDGRVVFVRGTGSEARLWLSDIDGAERRVTNGRAAERWPTVSPDGRKVAYVIVTENGRRLVVRDMAAASDTRGADSTVSTMTGAEHPAWSPAGDRLTFTVGGSRPGVYVTPTNGRYANLVVARHAESAWSPDGSRLALVDVPDNDVGYNGDPARVGDRDADLLARGGGLAYMPAPRALETVTVAAAPATSAEDRSAFNAAAFDAVWQRTRDLYYTDSTRRNRWDALRAGYRPRALAANSEDELRGVIHAMLRDRPQFRVSATGRAAVSSAHPVATGAGLEILGKGGNVVDAAAAVSFALGVVEPDASGVGGYGEMLVYRKGDAAPQLIEFMSRVPEDAPLGNADLLQGGRLPDDGPVLANVPGTVAAMHLAWKRYGSGKVTWVDVLAPAIRAARDGYVVSDGLATTLATEREHFAKFDGSRALFFRDGKPLRTGDTLKNPDLAWTLEQISRGGADAFYKGEVARRMVSDLRGKGNAMKLSDMARYFAAERDPIASTYRGYSLYSSAPPVAGGAQLSAMLNLLEQYPNPKPYTEDAATLHAMVSAWLLAPSSRNRIADPGLWPVSTDAFVNKDTARLRWRCYRSDKAPISEMFRGDTLVCAERAAATDGGAGNRGESDGVDAGSDGEAQGDVHREVHSSGTTSFTVADVEGNVVAVTQTLGTWGGNFYVTPGLGFIYNDKLGSYGTDASAYGARLPYARHGSTLAPTIVFEGSGNRRRPIAAVGAAGNAWITSAVYQSLVGMLDQKLDPQAALELPRFLAQQPNADRRATVFVEDGLAPAVERRLEEMGYRVQRVSLPGELREGYGAAVTIKDGKVTAGADPRRSGAAGAIP